MWHLSWKEKGKRCHRASFQAVVCPHCKFIELCLNGQWFQIRGWQQTLGERASVQPSIPQLSHGAEGAGSAPAEQTDEPWGLRGPSLCPCVSWLGRLAPVWDGEQKRPSVLCMGRGEERREREEGRAQKPLARIIVAGGVLPSAILLPWLAQLCSERLGVSNGSRVDQHVSVIVFQGFFLFSVFHLNEIEYLYLRINRRLIWKLKEHYPPAIINSWRTLLITRY